MAAIANNTPDSAVVSDAVGVHGPLPLHFFMERYTESYVAEMRAFLDCIAQDTPPPVSGADGRAAVVIGYAARRSLAENRPVRRDRDSRRRLKIPRGAIACQNT